MSHYVPGRGRRALAVLKNLHIHLTEDFILPSNVRHLASGTRRTHTKKKKAECAEACVDEIGPCEHPKAWDHRGQRGSRWLANHLLQRWLANRTPICTESLCQSMRRESGYVTGNYINGYILDGSMNLNFAFARRSSGSIRTHGNLNLCRGCKIKI